MGPSGKYDQDELFGVIHAPSLGTGERPKGPRESIWVREYLAWCESEGHALQTSTVDVNPSGGVPTSSRRVRLPA